MRGLSPIAAAMVLCLTSAPALAGGPWTVTYGADASAIGGYVDRSPGNDALTGRSDGELWLNASTMFESGIQLRLQSSLDVEGSAKLLPDRGHVDDVYVAFKGGFGDLSLGRRDGAASAMRLVTPSPVDRGYADDIRLDAVEVANLYTDLSLSGDNAKVVYMTPRVAGFQLGASYLVQNAKFGVPVHVTTDFARGQSGAKQATEAGLNYTGKIGGISLDAAATYYTDNHSGLGQRDPEGFDLGLAFATHGWTLGGNLTKGNNINHATLYSNNTKSTVWSAGVTYGTGPWLLGGAYARGADSLAGPNNDVGYETYVLGIIYFLNPGMTFGFGYQHDNANPDAMGLPAPSGGAPFAPGQDVNGDAVFVESGLKF